MVVPPNQQPGAPAPEAGRNEGGDRVLVSVRAEEHPTLLKGRRHGDHAAQGSQPSATEPPNRRREERKTNLGNKSHAGPRIPPWAPAPPSGKTPHLVPFTPLRAPPNDILAYAEECHIVRAPDPRPDPPGRTCPNIANTIVATGWPEGTHKEGARHPRYRKTGKKRIETEPIDQ
nr:hypothetical protein Iba_chr09eCG14170 [Ipomoea batatas]